MCEISRTNYNNSIDWLKVRAILFDFDGVVVNSEPLYEEAELELINAMGLNIPLDFFHHHKGVGEDAFYSVLIEKYGAQKSVIELKDWGRELLKQKFYTRLEYVPGFPEFFEFVKERYLTAIVTSTRRDFMEWIFENTPVENPFSEMGTIDDVTEGKPGPEPYLNMCQRLNVLPNEALVIEDSLLGLRSATQAGCQTVGITTTMPATRLGEIAQCVINHFSELRAFLESKEYCHEMV